MGWVYLINKLKSTLVGILKNLEEIWSWLVNIMVEKMWPALQSCKHQRYVANNILSQLPDDLLFIIMSFLTIKEAARTSVLSHRWNYLWRCFPVLIFEDISTMKRMFEDDNSARKERSRSNFLRWVNQIVDAHLGQYIDELRVTFDLKKRCQSDVDKWLYFALAKQVKRLELDFTPVIHQWKPSLPKLRLSPDQISGFKSCLRSLSLIHVNVTSKDVDCLLRSCMVLENLCINTSWSLRYIKAVSLPLQLKHLEVSFCPRLRIIDILAPKLLSFAHHGDPIELHINNASFLSKLSLGIKHCTQDILAYAFDSLSKYFPQLVYLSWKMQMYHGGLLISEPYCFEFNLGIKNPPAMTNLKHLELHVFALCEQSLLGWADLIEASPQLEKLTLKFFTFDGMRHRKIMKHYGLPLKSLKTLELHNDIGLPIDLEFITYVVENSIVLKDVIVELRPLLDPLSKYISVKDQVENLKRIVPKGVRLTINIVDKWEESL
ncbi:hypothetical protein RDABS01_016116 [Bienertia sinuspersici]